MIRFGRRSFTVVALVMLTLLLLACGRADLPAPSSAVATLTPDELIQRQEGGGVTVQVTWQPERETPTFQVVLDTHTVDLDGYDLTRLTVLRTEGGDLAPLAWDAPKGGHHRSGVLTFPATSANNLELLIRDVAEVPERSFIWTR